MKHRLDIITSALRGKKAPVIVYQWRGRLCMRARPCFVHNPRTPLQQACRSRFGLASRFAARLAQPLALGLRAQARTLDMTERNLFLSLNHDCFALSDGALDVDLARLVVSQGPVAPVVFEEVRWRSDTQATVAFSSPRGLRRDARADKVHLMAFCPARGESLLAAPVPRSARHLAIDLPFDWAGLDVHFYGFVTDADGQASVSTHLSVASSSFSPEPSDLDFSSIPCPQTAVDLHLVDSQSTVHRYVLLE